MMLMRMESDDALQNLALLGPLTIGQTSHHQRPPQILAGFGGCPRGGCGCAAWKLGGEGKMKVSSLLLATPIRSS